MPAPIPRLPLYHSRPYTTSARPAPNPSGKPAYCNKALLALIIPLISYLSNVPKISKAQKTYERFFTF